MTEYKKYQCKHCGYKFKVEGRAVRKAEERAKKTGDPSYAITCPICGSFPHTEMGTGVHRPEFAENVTEEIFGR